MSDNFSHKYEYVRISERLSPNLRKQYDTAVSVIARSLIDTTDKYILFQKLFEAPPTNLPTVIDEIILQLKTNLRNK